MKSFACWLLLGDNTSLSHKKNMAAKSVLSIQIVPYIPILRVCEPIATTLRVVVLCHIVRISFSGIKVHSHMHGTDAGGRRGQWVENWLQHKSLHVFTHTRLRSRDGVGEKSTPQEMAPTPNFLRPLWNRVPQSYFCPHRHGRSAQGPLPSNHVFVNMPVVAELEY